MAADRELAAARPGPRCTGGQLRATARDHTPIRDSTTRSTRLEANRGHLQHARPSHLPQRYHRDNATKDL
jgi:hypothetical protein